jgi:DNA-binding NarL/FixJ family response regulator
VLPQASAIIEEHPSIGALIADRLARNVSLDTGPAPTIGRECGIAELVTDRRTDREIAATLFLGEKTIETHLRTTFMKLGASSRVQVARVPERERRRTGAAGEAAG